MFGDPPSRTFLRSSRWGDGKEESQGEARNSSQKIGFQSVHISERTGRYLKEKLVTIFWLEESNDPASLQPLLLANSSALSLGSYTTDEVDHSLRAASAQRLEY